jgi:hypothetical protein
MAGGVRVAAGFEQEPRAPLGRVQEILEQTGRCGIAVLVGKVVRMAPGITVRASETRQQPYSN